MTTTLALKEVEIPVMALVIGSTIGIVLAYTLFISLNALIVVLS